MDNTQTGQEQKVETTTSVMPDQTKPADAQVSTQEQDQLPDTASERTRKEFEKLKEHNKQLADELAKLKQPQIPSVLDSLNPEPYQPPVDSYKNLSQQQVEQITNQFVDPEGYVNIQAVEAALAKANREASEANKKLQNLEQRVTRYEHDSQTKTTHEKHPYLDPANPDFDPKFYNLVKNELIGQMMAGKQDLLAAANRVKSELYDPEVIKKAKSAELEEKKRDTVDARTQATASPSPSRDEPLLEHADLVKRTMKGDPDALYERLKRSGY